MFQLKHFTLPTYIPNQGFGKRHIRYRNVLTQQVLKQVQLHHQVHSRLSNLLLQLQPTALPIGVSMCVSAAWV